MSRRKISRGASWRIFRQGGHMVGSKVGADARDVAARGRYRKLIPVLAGWLRRLFKNNAVSMASDNGVTPRQTSAVSDTIAAQAGVAEQPQPTSLSETSSRAME